MTTGKRIQQARRAACLSQKELAERLGVSASMIGQYENDLRKPKLETLQRIANALNVSIRSLAGEIHTIEIPLADYTMRMPSKEEIERMSPAEKEYYSLRLLADTMPDVLIQELTKAYKDLNKLGQVESVIRVRELAHCPKFTDADPNNTPLRIAVEFIESDGDPQE